MASGFGLDGESEFQEQRERNTVAAAAAAAAASAHLAITCIQKASIYLCSF